MFSKAKTKGGSEESPFADPMTSQANPPAQAKRSAPAKLAGVPSIISADVRMRGSIDSAGEVQLDGELEGDIRSAALIVGEKAIVRGEIVCDNVTVRGRVEGEIRAKTVILANTSHILGDILHSSLAVESGAHFEGNCRHSDDPLSDTAGSDFRRARPAEPPAPPTTQTTASTASKSDKPKKERANEADAPVNGKANGDTPAFLSPQRSSPLR
ncbi:MAG: polymer-forming cytoskeletal protein [Pseudomonadota bacterium]